MRKGMRVQLFSSAVMVTLIVSGCRSGQQQGLQRFQSAPTQHQLLIPTPDSLPMAEPGHAQSPEPVPTITTSAKPRRGLLKLLPSFKRHKDVSPRNPALPPKGRILTEEEFNALPGTSVPSPSTSQTNQKPSVPEFPVRESSMPPVTHNQEPVEPVQQPQTHRRQAQADGLMPPIRAVSRVNETVESPGLIRDFRTQNFKSESQMNFGGAWGQAVTESVPVQQQQGMTHSDPLEIANIDESYDLWPQAPKHSRPAVRVASQSPVMRVVDTSTAMETTTVMESSTGLETMSVQTSPSDFDHTEDSVPFEQPAANRTVGVLPVIVPAPRD